MNKKYQIHLNGRLFGTFELNKADPPMGVVFGELKFDKEISAYAFIKNYCKEHKIELACDEPEHQMISTMTIPNLVVTNSKGVKIKGIGNQITGMDNEEYELSIFGIPYPFYEEEFPHHVESYENMFKNK